MTKTFEIKTAKDGQQDILEIKGDFIETEGEQLNVCRFDADATAVVAVFLNWIYAREKTPEL